ncbi:hypothetical protein [Streptomyces sp. NPDC086838]|uniref:hypothetical protein n=1 Tax=Streptomyces sp. NPDC086838 TaxID=3365762 RepID=UPI003826EAEC
MEIAIGVVGAAVGVGGFGVAYAAYRSQARQNERIREREVIVAERERAADRRDALRQASMVAVKVISSRSSLDERRQLHRVMVSNSSDQPVRDLTVYLHNEVITFPSPGQASAERQSVLGGGASATSELLAGTPDVLDLQAEFTDVAGVRWLRLGDGTLRQGVSRPPVWVFGEPQPPIVEAFGGHLDPMPIPAALPPVPRRAGKAPLVLAIAVLVASAIWGVSELFTK